MANEEDEVIHSGAEDFTTVRTVRDRDGSLCILIDEDGRDVPIKPQSAELLAKALLAAVDRVRSEESAAVPSCQSKH